MHVCTKNILNIGPDCNERFVGAARVPEIDELDILLSGVSNLKGEYQVGETRPENHVLIYSVNGEGYVHTNEGSFEVEKSHLLTLKAGEPFLMELKAPSWTTVWFDLKATPRWNHLCHKRPLLEYCDSAAVIYHTLSQIFYEARPSLRASTLKQLDFYLSETLSGETQTPPETLRLDLLFREVEKRLHYSWSLEEMCTLVHYSSPHLHRLCVQRFGRSPLQHVIFLRMERAKYLLRHTKWSVAKIAGRVGYGDVFNFSKRFKKSVGVPPSTFRKA